MSVFQIADIMEMGIEKERKRRDFYTKLSQIYEDTRLTKLFGDLARWEEEHVERFTHIKNSLGEMQESKESYDGELMNYIEAYLDNKLYYEIDSEKFHEKVKLADDALTMAMHFEKDAIIFFTELFNFVDAEHKPTIKKLIDEEKQHLLQLYNMRKSLKN
ncbi:MAG: ferritin family protein [Candidatus Brocadiae bacterium]|nr:ferritin family protein [Candidatus Brocadiia bacterium]